MKTARVFVGLVLFGPLLVSAAPRFYFTAQGGRFNADAGTTELGEASPFVVEPIKSGTKSFFDVSLGAEFTDWFSLELGYVEFDEFSSKVFKFKPGIIPTVLQFPMMHYDLRGVRLTPVVRVFSTDRFALKVLARIHHTRD